MGPRPAAASVPAPTTPPGEREKGGGREAHARWVKGKQGGAGGPLAVIDCFGILSDDAIRRYFELGCEVKALGRGHIQRIKERVRSGE